jgi:alkyl sulfatase BDS1-like metallo-beta-lactamase superfamily hydrolase
VFADPVNQEARALCADALEQLGFAAESSTWRNAYLLGAQELRKGAPKLRRRHVSRDLVSVLPIELLLDYFAVRLDARKAGQTQMEIEWSNPETGECWAMRLENAAMTYLPGKARGTPDASVTLKRAGLAALHMGDGTLAQTFARLVESGDIALAGDLSTVLRLLDMLDEFEPMFNVVEP